MKRVLAVLLFAVIVVLTGCGTKSPSTTPPPQQPLDPQGNWLFTLSGANGDLHFAGQLYELAPPVVTSNPMGELQGDPFVCNGSLTVAGQASGTNQIDLTVTQILAPAPLASVSLTGTIADDQAHMSGSWTTTTPGECVQNTSGTWTALLLAPVTGTWSGTLSGVQFTLSLTEDVSQTDTTMGQVVGTATVTSPCFAGPLDIPAWTKTGPASSHSGENLLIFTSPDANGSSIGGWGYVDTAATTYTITFNVTGGACNGQSFSGVLNHS